MQVKDLTCEYIEEPIGIDSKNPRLSWIISAIKEDRNKSQSAYRILVSSSLESLERNEGDIWDSGKIDSDKSTFIDYAGQELKSRMTCFWKVKIWDEKEQEIDWSNTASWIMGIFPEDWQGEWIGERIQVPFEERFPVSADLEDCPQWVMAAARRDHPHGPGPENDYGMAIYLRKDFKTFDNTDNIEKAIIRVAGLGYYEISLNGEKIGDHVLDPGATDYSKSVLYSSYDVTKLLNEKENCLSLILGNGWYWVGTPDLFGFEKANWAAPPKCRLELEITYKNGKQEFILSDKSWNCTEQGPIRFNCIRSGEVYDARMELGDWNNYDAIKTDDKRWKPVTIVPKPLGILRAQLSPPMKKLDIFGLVKRNILEDGKIVYWFPKNNAGWIEIKIRGKEGQNVKIELNEMLNLNDSVDMYKHSGHTYGRYQTYEYICKGNGIESYHPRFTYAGFQYVQITGAEPDQIVEILARQVCTAFETAGDFTCSNVLINTINAAAKLTFLNGFHSFPEDCPQREKAGWTEDALISSFGSIYNYNGLKAYEKWTQDLMDSQHETGQIPDICPTPLWGKPTKIRETGRMDQLTQEYLGIMADPWWGGTIVMLPWKMYEHYGDLKILKTAYNSMKKYVDFLLSTTKFAENDYSYLIYWQTYLGEWLEVGAGGSANRTPKSLTTTQAFYKCTTIIADVASLLGKDDEEKHYRDIAKNIFEAFNEEFLDYDTGLYAKDSQSAQAMSLTIGLTPKEAEKKVFQQLVDNIIETRNGHLSTGIVGTYFLYKALSEYERPDIAYKIITAKGYPGFEHNLTRVNKITPLVSTTLWEDWGGANSLAHPVQGTVVSFFYEYLAGIKPIIKQPGFKQFEIKPKIIEGLLWVKCCLNTAYGDIVSNWEIKDNSLIMDIKIPANTIANVLLPWGTRDQIIEGKDKIKIGSGIKDITKSGNGTLLLIGSGTYKFSMPL